MDKAIVLLSGGIDSSTCLYLANKDYEVYALSINYYYRWIKEIESARMIAKSIDAELIEVDANFIKEAFHTIKFDDDIDARMPFYIASKNLIFYAIAAHYAEYMKAKVIVGGHNKEDMEFYADASKEYIDMLNTLLKKGSMLYNDYKIIVPLADLDKVEVLRLANELSVPLELTWSCHERTDKHCGRCYGCLSRIEAFNRLGLKDPTEYIKRRERDSNPREP